MSSIGFMSALAVVLPVVGCAKMADVSTIYRFPLAETKVVVTQTLGCTTTTPPRIVGATDVTATTSYAADHDPQQQGTVSYADFGGSLTDADLTVNLTSDGRLSGINSNTSGQGSTVLKNLVAIAAAVSAFASANIPTPAITIPVVTDCKTINSAAPKGDDKPKVVTFTYTVSVLYDTATGALKIRPDTTINPMYANDATDNIPLKPDSDSAASYNALSPVLQQQIQPVLSVPSQQSSPIQQVVWRGHPELAATKDLPTGPTEAAPFGFALLRLRRPQPVLLQVSGPDTGVTTDAGTAASRIVIWGAKASVPSNTYYDIPIPTGAVFGRENFALSLNDDGSISKLQYATNTSAPDFTDTAQAIARAIPTAGTRASELKDQIDLRANQAQLVACKADVTKCSK